MKRTKKMSKFSIVGLALVIGCMVAVTGALMSYYLQDTATLDADVTMEYSTTGVFGGEEENLETLDKTCTVGDDFCADDVEEISNFYIKVNSDLDSTIGCTFNLSDQSVTEPSGLNLHLEWNDTGTWTTIIDWDMVDGASSTQTYDFASGTTYQFRLTVTGDVYLMEGDYGALLSLDATEKLA